VNGYTLIVYHAVAGFHASLSSFHPVPGLDFAMATAARIVILLSTLDWAAVANSIKAAFRHTKNGLLLGTIKRNANARLSTTRQALPSVLLQQTLDSL
jgi:hypothetical protein